MDTDFTVLAWTASAAIWVVVAANIAIYPPTGSARWIAFIAAVNVALLAADTAYEEWKGNEWALDADQLSEVG